MTFTESNTVEALVRDILCGPSKNLPGSSKLPGRSGKSEVQETPRPYVTAGRSGRGLGWHYAPAAQLPRRPQDVFVEPYLREALIRLNPSIAARPERADEVLYKLRAIILAVRSDGLNRANELFTGWLRGEMSMPFDPNHEHVAIRLVDYDNLDNNQYVVASQYIFRAGAAERRADLALLVNGLPLVLVEAKTPVRQAVSWLDGTLQVHQDYERFTPELFACNVFSVATEGKALRYGGIGMPVELWGPWRLEEGVLNDRANIIVLVDEAHCTQEGDLGMKMRAALPNAFLFGLTGTPINRRDRNTFYAFGAEEDYRWLSQVYVSVQPTTGNGKLIWHTLGAKLADHQRRRAGGSPGFAPDPVQVQAPSG